MATKISATGRDSDKFMLRFPDGMRDRIAEEAKANGRSMNAEIVARLAASLVAGATDLHAADLRVSMEIVRREFEDEKRFARAQLLVATYQDQAALIRHRVDRERRLVEHLQAQLDEAAKHEDPMKSRIARELQDAKHWLTQVEFEYSFTQQKVAEAMADLEHARQSLEGRAKQPPASKKA